MGPFVLNVMTSGLRKGSAIFQTLVILVVLLFGLQQWDMANFEGTLRCLVYRCPTIYPWCDRGGPHLLWTSLAICTNIRQARLKLEPRNMPFSRIRSYPGLGIYTNLEKLASWLMPCTVHQGGTKNVLCDFATITKPLHQSSKNINSMRFTDLAKSMPMVTLCLSTPVGGQIMTEDRL